MLERSHISFCFGRWKLPAIKVEAALVWTAASTSLPVPYRKDVTFTKFHRISPKDARQKFAFFKRCGDPSGLPTYPTQLAPESAAKPALLLVAPAVWVEEAALSSPSLISLTACRIHSCNSSKESLVEGQEWEANGGGKAGRRFWHWCQRTWLEVFIKLASSLEISLSLVQAEVLVK